jgi:hypothetical protein
MNLVGFPSYELPYKTAEADKRIQDPSMRASNTPPEVSPDSSLCTHRNLRFNGFSVVDDNGDVTRTPGLPTFLLVDHTIDPLQISESGPPMGATGPSRVGFLAFRSYKGNDPYMNGGGPRTDQQRYEFMSGAGGTNIGEDGFINQDRGMDEKGDYQAWWSCGPWLGLPNGGSVQVTVAFTVADWTKEFTDPTRIADQAIADFALCKAGGFPGGTGALINKYPSLGNALAIQVVCDGIYELRPEWPWLTNGHGRETPVRPARGELSVQASDCRDQVPRTVFTGPADWFDFDCDYCTGAYDSNRQLGMFHRTWNSSCPPPNPNLNVAAEYNYSDNQSRIVPAGDAQVTLAWDNISEITPDPKSGWLDFRGYRVWKAANWQRPVGTAGPSDNDWALLGEFRQFHYYGRDSVLQQQNYSNSDTGFVCPRRFVPNYNYPVGSAHCPSGCVDSATVDICLQLDDLWDEQSGQVIHASPVDCVIDTATNDCAQRMPASTGGCPATPR